MQVWSAEWGYPGDYDYREFHKKDGVSGLQYWRVSGARVDLGFKDYYHPDWALNKVSEHSRHFAWLVSDRLKRYHDETGNFGLIASNYDTELFGHWWFEGIEWIKQVLALLAEDPAVELVGASDFIERHPPTEVLHIPEGSWGMGGTHWTWDNHDTHWMWTPIHEAEERMEALAARYPDAGGDTEAVLNMAARELLLLQSSDWSFLVTTGQAREYAIRRFTRHVERFEALATSLEAGKPDRRMADELYEVDKIYPDIDYRWFNAR
jgi:1,4-alpha-glucan branching enzyme